MTFKPNRPIRVGTKMMLTDAKGQVPGTGARKAETKADDAPAKPVAAPEPSEKSKAKKP